MDAGTCDKLINTTVDNEICVAELMEAVKLDEPINMANISYPGRRKK